VPLCNLQSTPINANTWQVNWTGLDDTDQIAAFNLRYRAPGTMEWLNWLQNLPGGVTSAVFTGQAGQNYSFWCQALDQAGNDSDRHIFLPIIAH
jgi:hypothetical protein